MNLEALQIHSHEHAAINDLVEHLHSTLQHFDAEKELPDAPNARSSFEQIYQSRQTLIDEWETEIRQCGWLPKANDDDQQWLTELRDHAKSFMDNDPNCLVKQRLRAEQQLQFRVHQMLDNADRYNRDIQDLLKNTQYHVIRTICSLQDQVSAM